VADGKRRLIIKNGNPTRSAVIRPVNTAIRIPQESDIRIDRMDCNGIDPAAYITRAFEGPGIIQAAMRAWSILIEVYGLFKMLLVYILLNIGCRIVPVQVKQFLGSQFVGILTFLMWLVENRLRMNGLLPDDQYRQANSTDQVSKEYQEVPARQLMHHMDQK
jgi:hypothetical protein